MRYQDQNFLTLRVTEAHLNQKRDRLFLTDEAGDELVLRVDHIAGIYFRPRQPDVVLHVVGLPAPLSLVPAVGLEAVDTIAEVVRIFLPDVHKRHFGRKDKADA